jgi:hypothetical protein
MLGDAQKTRRLCFHHPYFTGSGTVAGKGSRAQAVAGRSRCCARQRKVLAELDGRLETKGTRLGASNSSSGEHLQGFLHLPVVNQCCVPAR